MTARGNRQAVLVLSWIVVTTTATAVAWWAVTFVTTEVADRGPLHPSDVVAASARQVVPVPSWVSGGQPVAGSPPSASDSAAELASAGPDLAPDATVARGNGIGRVAAPPSPTSAAARVASVVGPRLVAQWTSTASSSHVAAAGVSDPVTVALSVPAPAPPAPTVPPVAATSSPEFAATRRTGFTSTTTVATPIPSTPAATVATAVPSTPPADDGATTAPVTGPVTAPDPVTVRRRARPSGQGATCPSPASPHPASPQPASTQPASTQPASTQPASTQPASAQPPAAAPAS